MYFLPGIFKKQISNEIEYCQNLDEVKLDQDKRSIHINNFRSNPKLTNKIRLIFFKEK